MTKNRNNDLWAEIPTVTELSPKELMKEQASYLRQKTKGLLTAEIVTSSFFSDMPVTKENITGADMDTIGTFNLGVNNQTIPEKITQTFYLVVPTIKYRYALFTVIQDVFSYPVEFIYNSDVNTKSTVSNETEFLATLKQILSSARTQRILSSLLGQAKS